MLRQMPERIITEHNATVEKEECKKAMLWKILHRISAVEEDIRKKDEGVPDDVWGNHRCVGGTG